MIIIISYSVRVSFGLRVLVNCDLLVMVMILLYPSGRWARLGFSNLSPSAGGGRTSPANGKHCFNNVNVLSQTSSVRNTGRSGLPPLHILQTLKDKKTPGPSHCS